MAVQSLTHFSLGQKDALMIFCTSSFIQQILFIHSLQDRQSLVIIGSINNFYQPILLMVVNKYSHAFTKVQLELIIDDYLGMAPYYTILHHRIKEYIRKIEEHSQAPHSNEKPHPIRIYTKDYFSKNFQEGDGGDLHIDMRTTYSSAVPKYYYIYPLEVIVEILESQSFYQDLPKNIIINHLLTTDNIQIIIETLTIVSEEMSKKIKTTLASKDVRRTEVLYKEKVEQQKEEEDFFQVQLPVIKQECEYTVPQSRVDIFQQNLFEEEQCQARKGCKKHTYNPMVRTDMPKGIIEDKIEKSIEVQKTCTFCQNYLTYLAESNGDSYGDDTLNKLSKESIRYLKIIAKSVTYFTLYLVENNLTQLPNNIHVLNRVLNTIGIVITQDIFNSQLNPKNIQPKQKYVPKPKNLIDHLAPYHKSIEENNKQSRKDIYYLYQLLRMIIYCPTVEQVSQQLKSYQIQVFQRETSVLKNCENQEKVKSLLKKEFNYIKEYESQRLQIAKNVINTKPIYKQLQFQQEKIVPQSIQPQNYNVNTSIPSSRLNNSSRHPFIEKTQTVVPSSNQSGRHFKKENKSVLVELANSVSYIYKGQNSKEQASKGKKSSKMKFKKQNQKAEETLSNNLKKNIIKSATNTHIKPAESLNIPLFKSVVPQNQPNQLSQSDFRKLLYNAFAKTQGFSKTDVALNVPNTPTGHVTAPNFTSFLSASAIKNTGKKSNGYSNSLTQFIGRKQEEEQMECMQKLEKETYNKQLLNGQFVKNELYEEIRVGKAKIYTNFAQANGLADSLVVFKQINNLVLQDKQLSSQYPQSVKNQKQSRIRNNVIEENSTKFNQSGLIRNEKYNKSIKNQLINHRQSYLRNVQSENLSKMHLAQTSKLKKNSSKNYSNKSIKEYYQEQLQRHLQTKQNDQVYELE